jgi:hypothetical protein
VPTRDDAGPAAVVLVEGPSDLAVLEVLAGRLGLDVGRVRIVSMGGVTNIRSSLRTYGPDGLDVTVTGLCDGSEERFFVRALRRLGHEVETRADMEALGFFVCDDDLEDELIRALGEPAVVAVVEREGELELLRRFQQQPAQRDRPLHDQLHRFSGVKSGRKVRLAAALAAELPLDAVPDPLLGVLTFAHESAARS